MTEAGFLHRSVQAAILFVLSSAQPVLRGLAAGEAAGPEVSRLRPSLPAFSFGVNTLQEGSWLYCGHLPSYIVHFLLLSPWHPSWCICPGPIVSGPTQAGGPCQLCHVMGSCGMSGSEWGLEQEIWKPGSAMLGGLRQVFFPPRASVSLIVPGNNDGGREESAGLGPEPLRCSRS